MENGKKVSLDELIELMTEMSSKPFWDDKPVDGSKVKIFFNENYPGFWSKAVKSKEGLETVKDIQSKYYQIKKVFGYAQTKDIATDPVVSYIADPKLIDDWAETYKKANLISENIYTTNPILTKKDNTLEKIFYKTVQNRDLIETRSLIIGLYNLVDFSNKNHELLDYAYNLSNKYKGFVRAGDIMKKLRDHGSDD